ncbi:MAG TPA: hypothetical protein VFA41_15960 [Ktedonobacteraceae bacterium]|jgi:hypothetical protein|nr:hypothetical protein [Ktedonobacteraceae bacterium]
MPKRHQQRYSKEQVGRNNPKKSTEITSGPYKKPETYEEEYREHKNPGKPAQDEKVPPSFDPTEGRSHKADSQAMMAEGERRSGSDSDADKHRKGSKLHKSALREPPPHPNETAREAEFDYDLNPDEFAGENHGMQGQQPTYWVTADQVKELRDRLADLTDDELRNVVIVPLGFRLEQGAKYIDLMHLEQGEFTATASMVADEGHYYVPKKEMGYVLWNRLNQVTTPARLDES